MAGELSCKKQQSCFAKIYLRMLQAILQHCNGQKYNVNETTILGQIKLTYAQQWDFSLNHLLLRLFVLKFQPF